MSTDSSETAKKESDHIKRWRGGLIMAGIGFGALCIGGLPFIILCSILFFIATSELITLSKHSNLKPPEKPILILVTLFPLFASFHHNFYDFFF